MLGLGLAGVAGVALGRNSRRQFTRERRRHVGELVAGTDKRDGQFDPDDAATLPDPARRYFERVLRPGQPRIRRGSLHQRGEFRLGESWHDFTAEEWFRTQPPGFVWDATIDVAPLLPARVLDYYRDCEGGLRARLWSTVPLASAGPDPAMNEGELLRYLAEAVWYPTALLPSEGVAWERVDTRAARATVTDRDVQVSATFHFGADDRVRRVTAERYRQEDASFAPWVGRFDAYETVDGIEIPTEGEVAWQTPDGDQPYWRGTIEDVEYVTGRSPGE